MSAIRSKNPPFTAESDVSMNIYGTLLTVIDEYAQDFVASHQIGIEHTLPESEDKLALAIENYVVSRIIDVFDVLRSTL
jgi:hypothetical protein